MKTTSSTAKLLNEYQDKHQLTQHEMAELLGVSQTTYNNWINGKSQILPKYYPVIAKTLKVDVGDLISPTATLSISNGVLRENPTTVNAKEIYEDFVGHLKEANLILKAENEALKKRVVELEALFALKI